MLHIISTDSELEVLFARIAKGDAIILMADAVLCLHKKSQPGQTILAAGQHFQCYALEADILARGLELDEILSDITLVDYQGFVALTIEHEVIKTWC